MILGIDLSAISSRTTGCAFFKNNKVVAISLNEDEEILEFARGFEYIFIDAPLSMPNEYKGYRECDRILIRMGIRVFPVNFKFMKLLTIRAMKLKEKLENFSKVYETFPNALYKMAHLNKRERDKILEFYKMLGYEVEIKNYNKDEIDAITCLIIGDFYIKGKALEIRGEDGAIVVPNL